MGCRVKTNRGVRDDCCESTPCIERGLKLPPELWIAILDYLRPLELASPIALTCKLFFQNAQKRIGNARDNASGLDFSCRLKLADDLSLPRIDRNNGARLFAVRTVTPDVEHALEVWNMESGKVEASCVLPEPLTAFSPEEMLLSPDGKHIAISYHKAVALLRYDASTREIVMIRGYELDQESGSDDYNESELESVLTTVRFSADGKLLAIAHLRALLNGDSVVQVTSSCSPVARSVNLYPMTSDVVPEVVTGADGLVSAGISSQYDERLISLHGVQVNPRPFQILIPPNRIADPGFIIGGSDGGADNGTILKDLPSFYEHQILGFSPDNRTLLETREVLLDETTQTTVFFHSTGQDCAPEEYGTSYNTTEENAAKVDLTLEGDLLSLQFSADSSALFLLHGWPHGARLNTFCIQGWTVIRRSSRTATVVKHGLASQPVDLQGDMDGADGPVAGRFGSRAGAETRLMLMHVANAARVNTDCTVFYAQDGTDGSWGAWDVLTGRRLWTGGLDGDDELENVSVEKEVIVAKGLKGFFVINRHGAGNWEVLTFRQ